MYTGANEGFIYTVERRNRLAGTLTFRGLQERSCMWKSWRMCHSQHTILYVFFFYEMLSKAESTWYFQIEINYFKSHFVSLECGEGCKRVFNHNSFRIVV